MILYYNTVFPVKIGSTLFLNQINNHQQADLTAYQRLIGKFIYLSCKTRLDIVFVVGQVSCNNSNP